jgi:hypothetical protein
MAKPRVSALRGRAFAILAANGSAAIEFRCGALRSSGQSRTTASVSGECRIKEIAVTGDTDEELNKDIAFGNDKVRMREVAQWLGATANKNSRWTKVGPFLSLISVIIASSVLYVAVKNLSYTTENYAAQHRPKLTLDRATLYVFRSPPPTAKSKRVDLGFNNTGPIPIHRATLSLYTITEDGIKRQSLGDSAISTRVVMGGGPTHDVLPPGQYGDSSVPTDMQTLLGYFLVCVTYQDQNDESHSQQFLLRPHIGAPDNDVITELDQLPPSNRVNCAKS